MSGERPSTDVIGIQVIHPRLGISLLFFQLSLYCEGHLMGGFAFIFTPISTSRSCFILLKGRSVLFGREHFTQHCYQYGLGF